MTHQLHHPQSSGLSEQWPKANAGSSIWLSLPMGLYGPRLGCSMNDDHSIPKFFGVDLFHIQSCIHSIPELLEQVELWGCMTARVQSRTLQSKDKDVTNTIETRNNKAQIKLFSPLQWEFSIIYTPIHCSTGPDKYEASSKFSVNEYLLDIGS